MGELTIRTHILRYRYGFDDGEERTLKEIGDCTTCRASGFVNSGYALEKMRAVSQTDRSVQRCDPQPPRAADHQKKEPPSGRLFVSVAGRSR